MQNTSRHKISLSPTAESRTINDNKLEETCHSNLYQINVPMLVNWKVFHCLLLLYGNSTCNCSLKLLK